MAFWIYEGVLLDRKDTLGGDHAGMRVIASDILNLRRSGWTRAVRDFQELDRVDMALGVVIAIRTHPGILGWVASLPSGGLLEPLSQPDLKV
jgi:hypothetical protein